MTGRVTGSEPSLARSRVWAPLGLLLVLACGAWFFRGAAWQGVPGAPQGTVPAVGWPTPSPEGHDGDGAAQASTTQPEASPGLPAAQALAEVARRGREAPKLAPSASGPVSAEALRAQVRQDPAAVHRQTAGRRLRLQGALAAVESGEPGVVVLHLALDGEPGTVRVVASPELAQVASGWAPPRALSLDCLSQGVMMGEWLLVDCRQ